MLKRANQIQIDVDKIVERENGSLASGYQDKLNKSVLGINDYFATNSTFYPTKITDLGGKQNKLMIGTTVDDITVLYDQTIRGTVNKRFYDSVTILLQSYNSNLDRIKNDLEEIIKEKCK